MTWQGPGNGLARDWQEASNRQGPGIGWQETDKTLAINWQETCKTQKRNRQDTGKTLARNWQGTANGTGIVGWAQTGNDLGIAGWANTGKEPAINWQETCIFLARTWQLAGKKLAIN